MRATPSGVSVCNFDIAVNRRVKQGEQPQTDYFRIAAWRGLGENCARYLDKGKKVFVSGTVSARAYQAKDGTVKAQMEVNADEVEFLSGRNDGAEETYTQQERQAIQTEASGGFTQVETDELPF